MPRDLIISLRVTDKQVAQKKAEELFKQFQQERAGLIPTKSEREAGSIPLSTHLEDYLVDLETRGKSPKYVKDNRARIGKLLTECKWSAIGDISVDGFIHWRSQQTDNLAAKTLNDYLAAAISLFNWMERAGRISRNPLRHVAKVDGRGKL